MKLVQTGILSLTLLGLASGFGFPPGGGLGGGFSGIFGLIILLIFIAALANNNNCPANYVHTPNDPSTCISFNTTPKIFADARAACQSDGGDLLRLDSGTFGLIRQLATNTATGSCNFWAGAQEGPGDGEWFALNDDPLPTTAGIFFQTASGGDGLNDCGLMNRADNFLLRGRDCESTHCYICQKHI